MGVSYVWENNNKLYSYNYFQTRIKYFTIKSITVSKKYFTWKQIYEIIMLHMIKDETHFIMVKKDKISIHKMHNKS